MNDRFDNIFLHLQLKLNIFFQCSFCFNMFLGIKKTLKNKIYCNVSKIKIIIKKSEAFRRKNNVTLKKRKRVG